MAINLSTLVNQTNPLQLAKVWANFGVVSPGTTLTIRSSYSVSSITRNGTGDYTINLSITMADLNYVMVGSNSYNQTTYGSSAAIVAPYTKTTTTCRILTNVGNNGQESQEVDVVIFGN